MKFIEFTTKVSKFPNFLYFRKHSPYFGPFPKIYSIKNTIVSRFKHVATDSVSKRYQTNFQSKLSKNVFCENVNFDLFCPIFNIQKPFSELTRYGVHLSKENNSRYSVG